MTRRRGAVRGDGIVLFLDRRAAMGVSKEQGTRWPRPAGNSTWTREGGGVTPSPSPSQRELFAAHVSTRKPAVGQLCRWKDEVSESERSAWVPWAAGFSSKQSLSFRAPEGQGQPTAGGGGGGGEDIAGCSRACRYVSLRRPGVGSGLPPKTQSQAVLASGAPRPTLWVTLRVLSHPRPGQETRLTARDHRGWPRGGVEWGTLSHRATQEPPAGWPGCGGRGAASPSLRPRRRFVPGFILSSG